MTVNYPLDNYQNRFDPAKRYEKHLFRSGKGTQAAEQNEHQENTLYRIKRLGNVIIKDGAVCDGAQCIVDPVTGAVQLDAGVIYLHGLPRDVDAANFTVPVDAIVSVGIRMFEAIVTELEDPDLVGPADGTRNQGEPGAARLQVTCAWGWDGDGQGGEFFAVYTIENGFLLSKEPPPAMDGVNNAIARYDRDSAGGNYVISGLGVVASYDRVTGQQTILIGEGRARVNGFGIEIARGKRLILPAETDTRSVVAEPKT